MYIALVALVRCSGGRSTQTDDFSGLHRALLEASLQNVESPDVSSSGACAADIRMHCQHVLTKVGMRFLGDGILS